jgi:endoglucanase
MFRHLHVSRALAIPFLLVAFLVPATQAAADGSIAGGAGRTLSPTTQFYVPQPDHGAITQIASLTSQGDKTDAALIRSMIQTPTAVWLTGGTPKEVQQNVKQVVQQAAGKDQVPVLVVYNIPGRDCSQYSAGGAPTGDAYMAWIDGIVAGLGSQKAVVLVEPDGLANLPTDCGQPDTYDRISLIKNAAQDIFNSDPNALVYLDAGHSAWHSVGDMAQRLILAGVQNVSGFFLDVSNYQYTTNQVFYGTWISECLTIANFDASYDFTQCPNQYWNGGPPNWVGVALSPYGEWSDTASDPTLYTGGIDARYASMLNGAVPSTHFVIDTSRNGNGPNDMSTYAASPYNQPSWVISGLQSGNWCNPPGSALGAQPTANVGDPLNTGYHLVDAYLWVKVPGQSDGQCDSAGGARAWDYGAYTAPGWPTDAANQALFDPLWGLYDPAAGQWFPQMALQLVQPANP